MGDPCPFTAINIASRKKRMQDYNVSFFIGFDVFGLTTENFDIKNRIQPSIVTKQNVENVTCRLKMLGYGFGGNLVMDTTDSSYDKWTLWIFLQAFKTILVKNKLVNLIVKPAR